MIPRHPRLLVSLIGIAFAVRAHTAPGQVLFSDNFDDGNSDGCTCHRWVEHVSCDPGGNCALEGGALVVRQNPDGVWTRASLEIRDFGRCQIDLDIMGLGGVDKHIVVLPAADCGHDQGYVFNLRGSPFNDFVLNGCGEIYSGSCWVSFPNFNGTWYHISIVVDHPRVTASVNGVPLIDSIDSRGPVVGGLDFYSLNNSAVATDNIVVTALPATATQPTSWGQVKGLYRN